ncbi:cyclin-T1 [Trichonephila inaurata madagascariensis]|uniref:Cyclin-T1 n=1 Tax=Trichonephila inaurata madagascariensis TaxID=2747483 RepID=A0A8X6YSZ4_9ARAC|nr:cyclin-T1 [Trichonephila inaurata madagascariensis]
MNEDYSVMDNANLWLFTEEQLSNTPSRKHINAAKELSYRKQDATFIQEMGESMKASRLIINTAIVYMHRFYMIRSFTDVKGNDLCTAALFLSSKINDKPLKLEHVIKVAHALLHRHARRLDVKSADKETYCTEKDDILDTLEATLVAIDTQLMPSVVNSNIEVKNQSSSQGLVSARSAEVKLTTLSLPIFLV